MAYQKPATHASDLQAGAYRDPRVSFLLKKGDELVQCAYDKVHWVLTTKISNHLVKCRHNYLNGIKNGTIKVTPETKLEICIYNSSHHLPKGEMDHHVNNLCESNPFRTDFFQQLDAEKERRDKIAEKERQEAEKEKARAAGSRWPNSEPRDHWGKGDGSGPYGDARNSTAGFWGTDQKPRFEGQNGDGSVDGNGVKMETDQQHEEKSVEADDLAGAVGGRQTSVNIKQEAVLGGNVKVKKMETVMAPSICGSRRSSSASASSLCGSRASSSRPPPMTAAALLKIKREEEAEERERQNAAGKFVRPGQFGGITTPFTHYKDKAEAKRKAREREQEEIVERGLTKSELEDPECNWELGAVEPEGPGGKFVTYDPRKYMKFVEESGIVFIQNPQGLTKSEKKAWRARQAELLLIEKPYQEEKEGSEGISDADRAVALRARRMIEQQQKERDEDLDDKEPPPIVGRKIRTQRGTARPACPGFELNLDMQENPVEEYENRSDSGVSSNSSGGGAANNENPMDGE